MALASTDIANWWDFSDGSGTSVTDQKGSDDISLFNTPGWVTSGPTNISDGVDFNGTDEYGDSGVNYVLGAGAVTVWVNVDASTSGEQVIIGAGNMGGDFDMFISDSQTDLYGRTRFGAADAHVIDTAFAYTTLYCITYTWDSADASQSLFVNGVEVDTNTSSGSIAGTSDTMKVSRRSGSSSKFMDGKVYQVSVANRKITLAEHDEIRNSGNGITYASLFPASSTFVASMQII